MKTLKVALTGAAAALLLSACGGGDDAAPVPATAQVSPSATASVAGLQGYLGELTAETSAASDTLSPVDVSNVTLPTSETDEPSAL